MNELRNAVIRNKTPTNENSDKIISIVEKILKINKQKILIPHPQYFIHQKTWALNRISKQKYLQ